MRTVWAILLIGGGCTDPNEEPSDDGGLDWRSCPLLGEEAPGPTGQCAVASLPLWSGIQPDGPMIEVFVQRRLGASPVRDRQLWLVPDLGQGTASVAPLAASLSRELPATDVYLFEHRGVGRSTRLSCPDQEADDSRGGPEIVEAEARGCVEALQDRWGGELAAFSTTDAARDLEALIGSLRGEQQVVLLGSGYGGRVVSRLLEISGLEPDAVVLDAPLIEPDAATYDAEFDEVGALLMQRCSAEASCRGALGPDPQAKALDVLGRMQAGACREAASADELRLLAGSFLADPGRAGFAPALFHRADRCNEADVLELSQLIEDDAPPRLDGPVLRWHVALSEHWREPWVPPTTLQRAVDASAFTQAVGPLQRELLPLWPRYEPEAGIPALEPSELRSPLRALQGALDPVHPSWRLEGWLQPLEPADHHLVRFADGIGPTLQDPRTEACALSSLLDFLDAPSLPPEADCRRGTEPLRFDGEPAESRALLGDPDRYGAGGCSTRGPGAPIGAPIGAPGSGPWGLVGLGVLLALIRDRRTASRA